MLNSSLVIQYLESSLGYKFIDLEITHEEILDNIRKFTLVTFSKYFPYQERTRLDVVKDKVEGYENIFYLTAENEIINVNRIVGSSILGANAMTDMLHPTAASLLYGDPISRQMDLDIISSVKNPITFIFYPPNKVEISPCANNIGNYLVILNVVHPDHFGTIPINLQDQFLQLCLYDTQSVLYNMRSRFPTLQTSFGNIELFLDRLSDAENNKKELLEEFRKSSLKYSKRKKIIIA